MKKYQSHKIVEAAAINTVIARSYGYDVHTEEGVFSVTVQFFARGLASPGDYLVRYQPDDYLSWSPKAVFEAGYRAMVEHGIIKPHDTPAAVEVTVTAPAGKRAEVTMMRGDTEDSVWTVTEGQSQTWACIGSEIITVREGRPHSTVADRAKNR